MIGLREKLSPHFSLYEMVRTSHRYIDNNPTTEIVEQLRLLCNEFLEPVRSKFGPIHINSGFRCPDLNAAIGGSKTSAHMTGSAADFMPYDYFGSTEVVEWIADNGYLAFDQVIDEHSSVSSWVHLGIVPLVREPRRQALTMRRGKYTAFKS